MERFTFWLLDEQVGYIAVLGLWPIIDLHSFQVVTGPKTDHLPTGDQNDHWLVISVGALFTVVGLALLAAAREAQLSLAVVVLGGLSAAALAVVDVVYARRDVISPIYLADAAIELIFVGCWLATICASRQARGAMEKEVHDVHPINPRS
jgi:hypothetical protein